MKAANDKLSWSLQRVRVIAGNTFREAVRMKLFLAMTILAVGALGVPFCFRNSILVRQSSSSSLISDLGV